MHQSVIKVTRWNLKVISLRIPLQYSCGAAQGVTEVLYTECYSLHPQGGLSEKFSCWNKWIILQGQN